MKNTGETTNRICRKRKGREEREREIEGERERERRRREREERERGERETPKLNAFKREDSQSSVSERGICANVCI